MDVTYGLLSNLVKTRSIQRILAPIASQISLLIILNESDDGSSLQQGDMAPCAKAVMQASSKLVTIAKQQAQSSTDKEFIAQTLSSCEMLELSSSNLYVASQRLESSNCSKESRNKLIQASKDVLQGTMKVLLVADDAEIRRLITSTHIVTEKLSLLNNVDNMQGLVQRFKEFTAALSVMMSLADKGQRDLIHSRQRERIITSVNVLKKCVSSLSVSTQSAVKYSGNPQAQIGKSYVVNEVQVAVRDIVEAVQNRNSEEEEVDLEEPGIFVTRIDLALESLSVERRYDLHVDLEMWTEEIVRHSMTVAHLCHDSHRDLIITTCQRVIQVKSRVIQMQRAVKANPDLPQIREDYDEVCETLIDEYCDLEKNVNISLLHLVVEHFKETTQPLERLVKKAVYSNMGPIEHSDPCITDFQDHAEKICQIANLASASSTDARRVQVIRTSVGRLEHLDPDIVPATIAISRTPHDKSVMGHLKLLMKEWTFELTNLLQVLDEMTDPKMFMLVSERKVEDDMNTCNGCILIADDEGFTQMLQSLIGRCRRVAQVSERIVDGHDDPVFRNGFMVFIQQLRKAITAVRAAGSNLSTDLSSKTFQDTLRRRFNLLQDSLIKVKAGLSDSNHPHILSPLRRDARGASVGQERRDTGRRDFPSNPSEGTKVNKLSRTRGGDHFVATSVPRLNYPVNVAEEEKILPQTTTSQKAELPRSVSLSVIPDIVTGGQTYAWKLVRDLMAWATKGDKQKVNVLCGDLLGWTNHIVDVTHTVLNHCTDSGKKKEMESVCYDVDQVAPQLLEKVKYVLHGDFSVLTGMKSDGNEWALKVEKVRAFVDITVESWKCVCDKVCDGANLRKIDLVKHQLETVQGHQQALCDLVSITDRLRWESQVKGQERIAALWEDKNDLENLTVTFKTTSEMMTDQGLREELVQLEQLGREWSVKVHSMVSSLQSLTEELLTLGVERKIWPHIGKQDGLVEYLKAEIVRLKDLLKSACYGDEDKKELYRDFLEDMNDCLDELKSASMRKKVSSISVTIATTTYSNLRLGLYRGVWILKAVQCVDMARQQTSTYSGCVDVLIEKAFNVRHTAVADGDSGHKVLDSVLEQFSKNVAIVRKKVLQAIQLSAELGKRSAVRQCLDSISQVAPQVVLVVKDLADPSRTSNNGDISWYRLLWCAKLRHLLTVLQQMSDIKPSIVSEILRLLEPAEACPSYDEISDRLSCDVSASKTVKQTGSLSVKSTKPNPTSTKTVSQELSHDNSTSCDNSRSHDTAKSPEIYKSHDNSKSPESYKSHDNSKSHDRNVMHPGSHGNSPVRNTSTDGNPTWANFEPVKVDLKAVEEQIHRNASRATEQRAVNQSISSSNTLPSRSPSKSPSKPLMALLKEAQYIQRQTDRWEDDNNPIVKVAKTMSTQIQHMTQYIRREPPITNHLGLVQTAKAVAENSQKVLKFAHILMDHCVDESFCVDLRSYCNQVPTVTRQLLILANVQLGTAKSDTSFRVYENSEADRILVQNAQNVMKRILQMMTACEAVCIKGLSPTSTADSESAVVLATQWRQKYIQHRQRGINDMNVDELGLRIVEDEIGPPALAQIFKPSETVS